MPRMRYSCFGIHSVTRAGVLVAAVACSALVLAQATEPPPPTVGQIRPGQLQPTFRAGVTLVTTDVIVRDRDGIFMPDLVRDDFKVFEDDIEQEIASLTLVHGGRVYNQLQPPPAAHEGIILPTSRPPNDTAGRIFVLFIDDLHLRTSTTPRVRQVFKLIADTLIHEGDLFGIISTGPSSIAVDMTYDRSVLHGTMDRITGDGLSIRDIANQQDNTGGPAEVLHRAHSAFKTAHQVLLNLEQVTDRRKVFIYLSNGYDFDPFPEERMNSGIFNQFRRNVEERIAMDIDPENLPNPEDSPFEVQSRRNRQFSFANLSADLAELTRVANRANTSFYTFDPRGLVAGPDVDENISMQEFNKYIFKSHSSLRNLAEKTGGLAVVNRNDFKGALQQIDAETSDYYIVGFYTGNPDPTLRTRRLRIELPRLDEENIEVRSRTHYTLPRGPA
jgi:VWFA-related protein